MRSTARCLDVMSVRCECSLPPGDASGLRPAAGVDGAGVVPVSAGGSRDCAHEAAE